MRIVVSTSVGTVVRMLTIICCVLDVTLLAEEMVFSVDCDEARFLVFLNRWRSTRLSSRQCSSSRRCLSSRTKSTIRKLRRKSCKRDHCVSLRHVWLSCQAFACLRRHQLLTNVTQNTAGLYLVQTFSKMVRGAVINVFIILFFA